MGKVVVFTYKVKVDGKEIDQTVGSINGFQERLSDLYKKLNNTQINSKEWKDLQKEIKRTEGAFDTAKNSNKGFVDQLAGLPGVLGTVGQSVQGVGKLFGNFNMLLKASPLALIATVVAKVIQKLGEMEGVLDPLNKITQVFSGLFSQLANAILPPIVFLLEKIADGAAAVGNFFSELVGGASGAGDALKGVSEAFDELEDSQAAYELAQSKSNRALAEAREIAGDSKKPIEERMKALKDAEALERSIAKEGRERALKKARNQAIELAVELGLSQDKVTALQKANQQEIENFANSVTELKGLNRDKLNTLYGTVGQIEEISGQEAKIGKKTAAAQAALLAEQQAAAKAAAQEAAARAKEKRQSQIANIDAEIKLLTGFQDFTQKKDEAYYKDLETKLKKYYADKNALEDKDSKLSKAQREVRDKEQAKAIADTIKNDQESRKKAKEDELKKASEDFQKLLAIEVQKNQTLLDESTLFYEKQKLKYGEDSNEAIAAAKKKADAQLKVYTDELAAITARQKAGTELTDAELKRIGELTKSIAQFGLLQDQEAQKDLDRETKKRVDKNLERMTALEEELNAENTRLERKKEILLEEDRIAKENYDAQVKAAGENKTKLAELDKNYTAFTKEQAKKRDKIEKDSKDARVATQLAYADAVGSIGKLISAAAGKNKGLAKAGLIIENAAGIASIVIQTQKNAAKAGYLTPAGIAIIAAGAAGVATAIGATINGIKQIDQTDAQGGGGANAAESQPRQLASGGIVSGPGGSTDDSIPAMLSNGESVINAASTQMFAPLLSAINQAGGGSSFQFGGGVTAAQIAATESAMLGGGGGGEAIPIKTYVVASDMTSMQQFDMAQKSRSTL
jgi:hypothetical protein